MGLYDAMLIKDNHIELAGGVKKAVALARAAASHMTKIEVEVESLDGVREVLDAGVDAILLDNMSPERMAEAVQLIHHRVTLGRAFRENACSGSQGGCGCFICRRAYTQREGTGYQPGYRYNQIGREAEDDFMQHSIEKSFSFFVSQMNPIHISLPYLFCIIYNGYRSL